MADVKTLPDEVLNLICEDLGQQREFSTLFKCAQSCTSLADPALRTMYRYMMLDRKKLYSVLTVLGYTNSPRRSTQATKSKPRDNNVGPSTMRPKSPNEIRFFESGCVYGARSSFRALTKLTGPTATISVFWTFATSPSFLRTSNFRPPHVVSSPVGSKYSTSQRKTSTAVMRKARPRSGYSNQRTSFPPSMPLEKQ
jgi:hypothetical protein